MKTLTLYHFTAAEMLRGIGLHGLTVGDVPTDINKLRGLIGVWFTTSPEPSNHGLEESALDKRRYRLTVELPAEMPNLHRWTEWSKRFVKPETVSILHSVATGWDTWYIVLGIVRPDTIVACHDTRTGELVPNWRDVSTNMSDDMAVPPWRRQAWQKRMLKDVRKALSKR
ncbi:hypothetical protein NKI19_03265 [Mesorhizobium sp. M0751]|uniref:hypothetical protein n=1 Tax=unclassified Mesorhizobium TaxID=325217 RepID=UPI00333D309A